MHNTLSHDISRREASLSLKLLVAVFTLCAAPLAGHTKSLPRRAMIGVKFKTQVLHKPCLPGVCGVVVEKVIPDTTAGEAGRRSATRQADER